jgi:Putative metallopeptidase
MTPCTNRKAAAFRRGGFLLFAVFILGVFGAPLRADETTNVEITDAQREEILREFVLANVEFTLLHEIGHALIHQFPIPVFGQEEDAADQIAITNMIIRHNADVDLAAINKLLMVSSQWLSEWEVEEEAPEPNAHAFWDSHSLAIQRFYNVNCLLFGSNPNELSFLFDTEMLPAERGFDCEQAYAQAFEANFWLLDTFGRGEDSLVPFNGIVVAYAQTRNPRHEKVRDWLVTSRMVQEVAARATELFPWRQPIRLLFSNCPGSAEAYYNRNVAEIVVCYELLELFLDQSEAALGRTTEVVCRNVGLRRLYGNQFGCMWPSTPRQTGLTQN